jgi:hypothetical protein
MSFSRPTATAFGANGERKVSITGADDLENMSVTPARGQSRTPYQSKIYAESNSPAARMIFFG